jgi:hypothetical protein
MSGIKEMVEIFPGRWIEITKRVKKAAGVRVSSRVKATIENGRIDEALMRLTESRNRKYSRLLVDEAVAVAKAQGMFMAVRLTGVHKETIAARKRQLRGCTGGDGTRYTLAQKQACVRLAKELMASPVTRVVNGYKGSRRIVPQWNHHTAFVEAGRRLGVNGHSIEYQWLNGMISLEAVAPSSPPRPPAYPGTA